MDYGGKGSNQAVGCARLGAQVQFVASIGSDTFGDMALQLYRDEGLDTSHVKNSPAVPTGVGFILVEAGSGQNCIALDPGANELLAAPDVAALEGPAAVLLTQLEISQEAAGAALAKGRALGAITILNPAPVRALSPEILQMVDVLTPNESEAKVLAGYPPHEEFGPERVAQDLLRRGVKQIVMTLGEHGALLVNESSIARFAAIPVKATDTTGAGDAFNAALATALAYGVGLQEAVGFAVVIGAMAVTREGVIPSLPRREDVLRFYRDRDIAPPRWFTEISQDSKCHH